MTLPHARPLTVLPLLPSGTSSLSLPHALTSGDDRPVVLARVDLEESQAWSRPGLTTIERGRDFYAGGDDGPALVRVGDDHGRLHPDVELHLEGPFVEHELRGPPDRLRALVRVVAVGDPVYLVGRSRLVPHPDAGSVRDAPPISCFSGATGPLHLYDEAAFRRLAAWYALPWYRKLSLMVRNR